MYVPRPTPDDFEVSGNLVYSLVANLQHEAMQPILQRYDLANINPDLWYPARDIVSMFGEMALHPNFSSNFVAVGMAAANLLIQVLPPEVQAMSLEQVLMIEEQLICANYRNAGPVFYRTTKQADGSYIRDCKTVWPDDLDYGFLYSLVRHFCPKGKRFSVVKDNTLPSADDGGDFLRLKIVIS